MDDHNGNIYIQQTSKRSIYLDSFANHGSPTGMLGGACPESCEKWDDTGATRGGEGRWELPSFCPSGRGWVVQLEGELAGGFSLAQESRSPLAFKEGKDCAPSTLMLRFRCNCPFCNIGSMSASLTRRLASLSRTSWGAPAFPVAEG
jgi:hypothetical protein